MPIFERKHGYPGKLFIVEGIDGSGKSTQIALLKKWYPATSAVVLAGKLKRSLISVQKQLREMHIGRRKESGWTVAQLGYLRRNYKETATWEIASCLRYSQKTTHNLPSAG